MSFSVAMIGASQFAGSFAHLFDLHPGVSKVYAADVVAQRADDLVARYGLAGTFASFEEAIGRCGNAAAREHLTRRLAEVREDLVG